MKSVNGLRHNVLLYILIYLVRMKEEWGRHGLSALWKEGVGTKLKVMKDLCLIPLLSSNSTARIQLKAHVMWELVIKVACLMKRVNKAERLPQRTLIILVVTNDTMQYDVCS